MVTQPRPLLLGVIGRGRMASVFIKYVTSLGHRCYSLGRDASQQQWDLLAEADLWVEFALPEGFQNRCDRAFHLKKPFLVGTTGLKINEEELKIKCMDHQATILIESNFSFSVHLFFKTALSLYQSRQKLGGVDQILIEETHHRGKLDKPSGTALTLQNLLLSAGAPSVEIKSYREGQHPGRHRLILIGQEQIILEHRASDRLIFAQGALRAAEWMLGQQGFLKLDTLIEELLNSQPNFSQ